MAPVVVRTVRRRRPDQAAAASQAVIRSSFSSCPGRCACCRLPLLLSRLAQARRCRQLSACSSGQPAAASQTLACQCCLLVHRLPFAAVCAGRCCRRRAAAAPLPPEAAAGRRLPSPPLCRPVLPPVCCRGFGRPVRLGQTDRQADAQRPGQARQATASARLCRRSSRVRPSRLCHQTRLVHQLIAAAAAAAIAAAAAAVAYCRIYLQLMQLLFDAVLLMQHLLPPFCIAIYLLPYCFMHHRPSSPTIPLYYHPLHTTTVRRLPFAAVAAAAVCAVCRLAAAAAVAVLPHLLPPPFAAVCRFAAAAAVCRLLPFCRRFCCRLSLRRQLFCCAVAVIAVAVPPSPCCAAVLLSVLLSLLLLLLCCCALFAV